MVKSKGMDCSVRYAIFQFFFNESGFKWKKVDESGLEWMKWMKVEKKLPCEKNLSCEKKLFCDKKFGPSKK